MNPKQGAFLDDIIKFALIALIIVVPIRWFVAQPFVVKGPSGPIACVEDAGNKIAACIQDNIDQSLIGLEEMNWDEHVSACEIKLLIDRRNSKKYSSCRIVLEAGPIRTLSRDHGSWGVRPRAQIILYGNR